MGQCFQRNLGKHRLSLALCSTGQVSIRNDMSGGAGWFQLEKCHSPACSVLTCLWQHRAYTGGASTHLRAPLGHPHSRKLKLSSFPVACQGAAARLHSQASPRTPGPAPAPGSSAGHLQGKGLILEQHRNSSCQKATSGGLSCSQLTHVPRQLQRGKPNQS